MTGFTNRSEETNYFKKKKSKTGELEFLLVNIK